MLVKRELDFSDLQRECWSGAVDTLNTIYDNDKEDMFMQMLEENYCDEVPTLTEINDLLWFDSDWIFESLGISDEDDDDDDDLDDDEDWDDDDWDNDPRIDEKVDGDRYDFA